MIYIPPRNNRSRHRASFCADRCRSCRFCLQSMIVELTLGRELGWASAGPNSPATALAGPVRASNQPLYEETDEADS